MELVTWTRLGPLALILAVASALPALGRESVSGSRVINLAVSETEAVPALSVPKGRLTTVTFVDGSDEPWPIRRVVASEGAPIVEREASHPHVATLRGRERDRTGDVVVLLDGLDDPIHLQIARGALTAPRVRIRIGRDRAVADALAGLVGAAQPLARKEVETIIRDYLLANPEVLREAMDPSRQLVSKALALRGELVGSEGVPVGGDPSGTVTVVEFFDYNCGFCKRSLDAVRAVAAQPGVRLELRDYPILGEESMIASRLALAAGIQGRYLDAHYALMQRTEGFGAAELPDELAATLGLDAARLRVDMGSAEVTARIEANRALARRLGVTGTPAFLVLGRESAQVSPGALDEVRLLEMIASVE